VVVSAYILLTINLELIRHHPGIDSRTSPHTQLLQSSSGPPGDIIRSSHLHPSQTQSSPSQQVSPPTSPFGKRPSFVFRNADSNKKKQKTPIVSLLPLYSTSPWSYFQHSWYHSRKMGIYPGSPHFSIS